MNWTVQKPIKKTGDTGKAIQQLITKLQKSTCSLGVAYEAQQDTYFANKLLHDPIFMKLSEKESISPVKLACDIMKKSARIDYRKGVCAGPKAIYQNYAQVYNLARNICKDEIDEFILQQAHPLKEKLLAIKKSRQEQFPYKAPFSSIEHVKVFIEAIRNGEL